MSDHSQNPEFITIVGDSFEDVAAECRAQKLYEKHYAIVSPIGRHQFAMAGSEKGSLDGRQLVTATFVRRQAN